MWVEPDFGRLILEGSFWKVYSSQVTAPVIRVTISVDGVELRVALLHLSFDLGHLVVVRSENIGFIGRTLVPICNNTSDKITCVCLNTLNRQFLRLCLIGPKSDSPEEDS